MHLLGWEEHRTKRRETKSCQVRLSVRTCRYIRTCRYVPVGTYLSVTPFRYGSTQGGVYVLHAKRTADTCKVFRSILGFRLSTNALQCVHRHIRPTWRFIAGWGGDNVMAHTLSNSIHARRNTLQEKLCDERHEISKVKKPIV